MKSRIFHWLAIILILEVGLIHFVTAQHEYEEAAYVGYLFVLNFTGALLAAYGIYRRGMWGWWLGLAIAAGSIAGYIWSCTLGLPGTEVEEWFLPSGVIALALESLYVLIVLARPWRTPEGTESNPHPALFQHLLPASVMVGMILIAGYANLSTISAGDAHHAMGDINQLRRMIPISQDVLEQRYGMRITQAAISALDSIVDVRIKVVDPEKAHPLLEDATALFVDGQAVILSPHMHTHAKLKPGQIYVMFFPTQNRTVHFGSEISLVFGDLRVEPVITK